jgi:hypothetical protein
MIREDAENFQKQLVHLFRVFEVDVAVGLTKVDDEHGVSLLSQTDEVECKHVGRVKAQKAKKKDVLSG